MRESEVRTWVRVQANGIVRYLAANFRPSDDELRNWMLSGKEMDVRLAGSDYASLIDHQYPQQRALILSALRVYFR